MKIEELCHIEKYTYKETHTHTNWRSLMYCYQRKPLSIIFIYLSDRHHFEINHYGSPRRMEGTWIFLGKRHERRGVGSFLSKAPHTRFLGLGYVPGGHGEIFPSPTAEGIPRTHISSHLSNMCKYTTKQAQRNIWHEMLI